MLLGRRRCCRLCGGRQLRVHLHLPGLRCCDLAILLAASCWYSRILAWVNIVARALVLRRVLDRRDDPPDDRLAAQDQIPRATFARRALPST